MDPGDDLRQQYQNLMHGAVKEQLPGVRPSTLGPLLHVFPPLSVWLLYIKATSITTFLQSLEKSNFYPTRKFGKMRADLCRFGNDYKKTDTRLSLPVSTV
ncbi:hypothetical protein GOODEAATRI_007673 [Goodea atripinnis]|uniref:Uncharacterized protein n=1 Tax=Goodea atripinnis TaxID=208336 RepID=A0ABV0NT07_9TELE